MKAEPSVHTIEPADYVSVDTTGEDQSSVRLFGVIMSSTILFIRLWCDNRFSGLLLQAPELKLSLFAFLWKCVE